MEMEKENYFLFQFPSTIRNGLNDKQSFLCLGNPEIRAENFVQNEGTCA